MSSFAMYNGPQTEVLDLDRHRSPHQLTRLFSRPDRLHDPLYVVTTIFNPVRFRSRWRLYEDFAKMVAESGAILYTVEIALGDRAFVVTQSDNPRHVQLRTFHEIWFKEAALNLGVARLPQDWSKVAWVDADMAFARHDWADETRHLLEHYPVLQMWSQLHDLNSRFELLGSTRSFGDVWNECGPNRRADIPVRSKPGKKLDVAADKNVRAPATSCDYYYAGPGYPGAPGLAWAMRREAWNQLGGLIDCCILGAGDWYMAHCLTGRIEDVLRPQMHDVLKARLRDWQHRAETAKWQERAICGHLGVMKGLALHYFHGAKVHRRYKSRESILYGNDFNPDADLKRDWQGLFQLTDRSPQLRRSCQKYFAERNEDET